MRLKELRTAKNLYQKDIATLLGVDRTTYSKYESGASEPNREILLRLAQIFDVSTDYLLGRTDEKETLTQEGERKVEKQDLMAAFWGGDKDLSQDDMNAMWTDVENFAAFVAQQKKREKQK